MSLILDGTSGVTFPNSTVQASAGAVLQVVTGTYSTQTSTTSTTPVTTGFSATITPKFTTSKILVIVNSSTGVIATGNGVVLQLWRGGASVFSINTQANYVNTSGTVNQVNQQTTNTYLDSPATTSATTYTVYFASLAAGTAYFSIGSNASTITLMEIAA